MSRRFLSNNPKWRGGKPEEKSDELWITHNNVKVKIRNPQTLASQIWGYRPGVGWITPDGQVTGCDGGLPPREFEYRYNGKQVFSEIDPYGEENW